MLSHPAERPLADPLITHFPYLLPKLENLPFLKICKEKMRLSLPNNGIHALSLS